MQLKIKFTYPLINDGEKANTYIGEARPFKLKPSPASLPIRKTAKKNKKKTKELITTK